MCLVLVRDSLSPSRKRILLILIDVLILVFAIFVITIGGFKLGFKCEKVYSALLGISESLVCLNGSCLRNLYYSGSDHYYL